MNTVSKTAAVINQIDLNDQESLDSLIAQAKSEHLDICIFHHDSAGIILARVTPEVPAIAGAEGRDA